MAQQRGHRRRRGGRGQRPRDRINRYYQNAPEAAVPTPQAPRESKLPAGFVDWEESDIEYLPALLSQFPELNDRLSWVSLRGCEEPSLPKRLVRSSHLFGENHMFMKCESLDFHLLPENSARKLEFILGDLVERGKRGLVSYGPVGSLDAISIAKACQILNLKYDIILTRAPLTMDAIEMAASVRNMGGTISFASTESSLRWKLKWKKFWGKLFGKEILEAHDASPRGVLGYLSACLELKRQVDDGQIPQPDIVYMPVVRGGTLVGLELGRRILGWDAVKFVGISVSKDWMMNTDEMANLGNQTVQLLNAHLPRPLNIQLRPQDFTLLRGFEAPTFGEVTEEIVLWMSRFQELESMELDPIVTARALYALSKTLEKDQTTGKVLMFWNTSSPWRHSDLPAQFKFHNLPRILKKWVNEDRRRGRLIELGKLAS